MPQVYTESPTYFSQIVRGDLASVNFAHSSAFLRYVDDLLLCSASKEACLKDSLFLLTQLAHKARSLKEKVPVCSNPGKLLESCIKGTSQFPTSSHQVPFELLFWTNRLLQSWVPNFLLYAQTFFPAKRQRPNPHLK